MENRAHALAREELVRTLAAYSGTTTADGSSGKNTLIDSALIGKNDFLTGKSVLIMSGDAQYETAGISDFNSTTGEITFTALNAQIVAGVSFRVLNVLPESVHISSGQVQIQGYDYASGEYRLVAVNESGQIEIKATVADIVTARVSGVVAVVSGEIHVMSGQIDVFMMSGEVVAKVSGETVIAKISGETVIAKVSGEAVKISGETVIAKISGEAVHVSSGHITIDSGQVIAKVSGEVMQIIVPTIIKTGPVKTLSDASGGVVLHSGAVKAAVVKALTANSGVVLIGGSGDRPWYEAAGSAQGMILAAGEAQSKDISDFDQIYVVAQISGDRVAFDGVY
ncbi:MAG TPA: hypothetical protein VMW64_08240 [Dehalococcoidia bacterium]|nr:hypothetical protein [Dehalococcoidia bacterium]